MELIRSFNVDIHNLTEKETEEWFFEFQGSLAHLEQQAENMKDEAS